MKKYRILSILMAMAMVIGVLSADITSYADEAEDEALTEGIEEEEIDLEQEITGKISINGVDLSGMTYADAQEVLEEYLALYEEVVFTFTVGEESMSATAEEVGLCIKNDDVIERALNYGNEGNILDRYLAQSSQSNGETKDFALSLSVDIATLVSYFEENENKVVEAPVNNTVKLVDGEFVFVEGQAGTAIVKSLSAMMVANYISSEWDGTDVSFELYTEQAKTQSSA